MFTSLKRPNFLDQFHSYRKIKELLTKEASLVAQLVKNLPAIRETWVRFLDGKIPWGRAWQPTPVFSPGECHGQRSLEGWSMGSQRVGHD